MFTEIRDENQMVWPDNTAKKSEGLVYRELFLREHIHKQWMTTTAFSTIISPFWRSSRRWHLELSPARLRQSSASQPSPNLNSHRQNQAHPCPSCPPQRRPVTIFITVKQRKRAYSSATQQLNHEQFSRKHIHKCLNSEWPQLPFRLSSALSEDQAGDGTSSCLLLAET